MRSFKANVIWSIFAWISPAYADLPDLAPESADINTVKILSPYKERRISRLCRGSCTRGLELGIPYTRIEINYSDDALDEPFIRTYRFHYPHYCSDQFLCEKALKIPGYYYTYSCKSLEMSDETGTRLIHCM